MSFQAHLTEVAVAVRHLAAGRDPIGPADLDLALTAHATAVDLLQQVHGDLAGRARDAAAKPTLTDVETRPLGALYQLLRHHPRRMPIPITDALRVQPTNSDTAAWQGLARHATLAVHHWHHAEKGRRPSGDAAWPHLADVAAISQYVPRLTARIAGALAAAGDDRAAERFTAAATDGLSTAAGVVRNHAAEYATGVRHDEPIVAAGPKVLVIRKPEHLPAGLNRLAYLIRVSTTISPQQTQLAARTLIRTAAAAIGALSDGENAATAALLQEHRQLLGRVATTAAHVTDLGHGDPQVLRQLQQIHQAVRSPGSVGSQTLAQHVAVGIASVTEALQGAAVEQLDSRSWLVRNHNANINLDWIPASAFSPPPPVVEALDAASRQVKNVRASLAARPQSNPTVAAHAVLSVPSPLRSERPLARTSPQSRSRRQ